MGQRQMNTKLLRKVARHIEAEPRRLMMSDWIQHPRVEGALVYDGSASGCQFHLFAKCNTAACIAGWTVLLSDKRPSINIAKQAAKLLQLETTTCPEDARTCATSSDRLFYLNYWPPKYSDAYETAKTPRGKASVTLRRIAHFIKTKGAE